jgi:hypothetical protein
VHSASAQFRELNFTTCYAAENSVLFAHGDFSGGSPFKFCNVYSCSGVAAIQYTATGGNLTVDYSNFYDNLLSSDRKAVLYPDSVVGMNLEWCVFKGSERYISTSQGAINVGHCVFDREIPEFVNHIAENAANSLTASWYLYPENTLICALFSQIYIPPEDNEPTKDSPEQSPEPTPKQSLKLTPKQSLELTPQQSLERTPDQSLESIQGQSPELMVSGSPVAGSELPKMIPPLQKSEASSTHEGSEDNQASGKTLGIAFGVGGAVVLAAVGAGLAFLLIRKFRLRSNESVPQLENEVGSFGTELGGEFLNPMEGTVDDAIDTFEQDDIEAAGMRM